MRKGTRKMASVFAAKQRPVCVGVDPEDLYCGHGLVLGTEEGNVVLHYHGRDKNYFHVFHSGTDIVRYSDEETRYLCSIAISYLAEDSEDSPVIARNIMEDANTHYMANRLSHLNEAQHEHDGFSIKSVPVSESAHEQNSGTCYAHACATAIRATQARIIGRVPTPFQDLFEDIIGRYGTNGGCSETVLKDFCKRLNLGWARIDNSLDSILTSLRASRVVVTSFDLYEYEWHLFTAYFRQYPHGVLRKEHFQIVPPTDYPPELRNSSEGHAIVITGFGRDEGSGKVVLKIKNSWGEDFANDGHFLVEYDAFPEGFDRCYDVFFTTEMLSREDFKNYFDHILSQIPGVTLSGSPYFRMEGCGSPIFFSSVASALHSRNQTAIERKALARILEKLRKEDDICILSRNGKFRVEGSNHIFGIRFHDSNRIELNP